MGAAGVQADGEGIGHRQVQHAVRVFVRVGGVFGGAEPHLALGIETRRIGSVLYEVDCAAQ